MLKQEPKHSPFSIDSFIKDVGIVGLTNIFVLLTGMIQTLIIPKYLSVVDYGYWRIFTLYLGYVGFFHLGYNDGLYISWLGKSKENLMQEFSSALKTLIIFQLILVGTSEWLFSYVPVSQQLKFIGRAFFVQTFFLNIWTFFQFTFQASRQFKILSLLNILRQIALFVGIVTLLVWGRIGYRQLTIWQIIVTALICFMSFWVIPSQFRYGTLRISTISLKLFLLLLKKNISLGWHVLIGNFAAVMFFSLDKLLTSSFFSVEEFAMYSLASSFIGVVYLAINTVGTVFLPYLSTMSKELLTNTYLVANKLIIVLWMIALGLYLPLERFIIWYLPLYEASIPIFRILLCTIGFGASIQIVHSNFYKTNQLVRTYSLTGSITLALYGMLLFFALWFTPDLEMVAGVAVFTFGLWYLLNEWQLFRQKITSTSPLNRMISILIIIVAFLITSNMKNMWVAIPMYFAIVLIVACKFLISKKLFGIQFLSSKM